MIRFISNDKCSIVIEDVNKRGKKNLGGIRELFLLKVITGKKRQREGGKEGRKGKEGGRVGGRGRWREGKREEGMGRIKKERKQARQPAS